MNRNPQAQQQQQRRNGAGRGGSKNQRRRQRGRSKQADIWRTSGELPEVTPIEIADDPTALLRSLGAPPPLGGKDIGYYFESVAVQSTQIAMALAISVDLLAQPPS